MYIGIGHPVEDHPARLTRPKPGSEDKIVKLSIEMPKRMLLFGLRKIIPPFDVS